MELLVRLVSRRLDTPDRAEGTDMVAYILDTWQYGAPAHMALISNKKLNHSLETTHPFFLELLDEFGIIIIFIAVKGELRMVHDAVGLIKIEEESLTIPCSVSQL